MQKDVLNIRINITPKKLNVYMKYKLLYVDCGSEVNIGDYIQALASSQFLPHIDGYVNREELNRYDGSPCKVIMNGWYMFQPENWPPSSKIIPLFVAFHLNVMAMNKMLGTKSVHYLKEYAPIGCRDYHTMKLLESKGIKAYFSACMTLTLGKTYASKEKDNTYYFVDPAIPSFKSPFIVVRYVKDLLSQYGEVVELCGKIFGRKRSLKNLLKTAAFIHIYSKVIDKSILTDAVFITHQSTHYKDAFSTHESRLAEAERLVKLYSKAKLVVTSRIHCALPCLGMNTPVVFTEREGEEINSACRFEGLRELFNVMSVGKTKSKLMFEFSGKISKSTIPQNKSTWMPYAEKLSQLCRDFVKEE